MRSTNVLMLVAVLGVGLGAAVYISNKTPVPEAFPALQARPPVGTQADVVNGEERATFGAGCFWCTEAVFQRVKGVRQVLSGYCAGNTGHAEVVQVTFDPAVISYAELLEIFWRTHDPTTLNRQGHDEGTQYRSVIFYHNPNQKQLAEEYKKTIDAAGVYTSPIVTEIAPYQVFYIAEGNHQNYFAEHGRDPYCRFVIRPKLDKLEKVFAKKLKVEQEKR